MVPVGQWVVWTHAAFWDGVAHTDPAGHALSAVEPIGHQLPEAHAICDDVFWQYEPAAHAVWAVEPAGQ